MNELEQELFEKRLISLVEGIGLSAHTRYCWLGHDASAPCYASTLHFKEIGLVAHHPLDPVLKPDAYPSRCAAIIEFIQIGIVRISRGTPTPPSLPNEGLPSQ